MKHKVLKYSSILVFLSGWLGANAQQNLTLYNMPSVMQSLYTNPSQMPQCKMYIGLPVVSSIYLNVGNSGFRVTDLLQKQSDDSLHIEVNNMLGKLATTNLINLAAQINLFSFGMRIGDKNFVSFSVIAKENTDFSYQKNFLSWAWQGNGAFLGQNETFKFGFNETTYIEYGIGLVHQMNDKLTIGAKLKYLYGIENVWAQDGSVTFNTAQSDFGYTTNDNVRINTSGVDSAGPLSNNFNPMNVLFKQKNGGIAVDLGATYKYSDKITFSASVIDLGYISWNSDLTNYSSQGAFNFDGISIPSFIGNGDSALNKLADSAKKSFSLAETHKAYTNMLPTQVYLAANYKLTENKNVGLVVYNQFFNGNVFTDVAASFNMKLTNWFSFSASYAYMNRDFANLGLGFAITGPVQWFVVTDNVVGLFLPQSEKTVNIRTGIVLCFGRKPVEVAAPAPAAPAQY